MNNYSNAQDLASYGRGNDTELVHMTPGEVKGLQALALAHGGSLTINPETGLPEAGFLEQILPVVAAAGLTYLTAGAAAPLMAGTLGATGAGIVAGAGAGAIISGGFAATQGKDVEQAALMGGLGGAISGGLGAYGDAGTFAAADAAAQTGAQATTVVPAGAAPAIPTNAMSYTPSGEMVSSAYSPAITGAASPTTGFVPPSPTGLGANPPPVPSDSYYSGLKPDQYIQKAGIQALPAVGLLEDKQSVPGGPEEDEYTRRLKKYRLSPDYKAYEAPRPNPYYRASYAAEGGVMSSFDDETGSDTVGMARGGIATDNDPDTRNQDALTAAMTRLGKAGKAAGIKTMPLPKASIKRLGDIRGATPEIESAAGGGIMSNLGGYSDGGRMLKGPGDGMSDSIPGVIGGKQPARLADGEFVVPADVVSHLGNGSTDAGAKKLYGMMDNIRKARTGKKKQAPQVNVDKYLPGKKKASGGIAGYAEGGITGYATGGEVAALYDSVLGRKPDAAGLEYWTNSGLSTAEIAKAMAASPEARTNQVQQIFNEQLGRGAEQTAVDFYTKALAGGQSVADVSKGIAQELEGQNLDRQGIASVYRQVLGRNPEPAGQQYWFSVAQREGLTANQLKDRITAAAAPELITRNIAPGTKHENLDLAALESDPFAGYYSNKSIYDVADDAENVSMIDGRRVQFTTPVTRQAVVSKFIDGVFTANPGVDIINEPHIQAAINTARDNGTLTEAEFNNITNSLRPVNGVPKTAAETREILSRPQARVIIDNLYGQQIGEDANAAKARLEADARQRILNENDTGYYQSNQVLSDAYKAAGLTVPFNYGNYEGVDTRDRTPNVVTPENLAAKQSSLLNSLNRNNPFRVNYQPIDRTRTVMPESVSDPYSMAGLKTLYGQMMGQYSTTGAQTPNPYSFVPSNPFTYTPPPVNNLRLTTPIRDAAKPGTPVAEAAPVVAAADAVSGSRAGGLLSVNHKKRRA